MAIPLGETVATGGCSGYGPVMARFTGRSGEKRFSTLCSDLGITCNESVEDEHGWDHIVEFPHEVIPGVPADMQYRLPPVFVQTKSHEADGMSVRMKLSNAVSLARSPNPSFIVLMSLKTDSVCPVWHAVHVWEDLLERIMKRAREESRDGVPEDEFHRKTFSFTMTPGDQRDELDLLPWIESTVGGVGRDYAAAKVALLPPADIIGAIEIGPLASVEELMNHMIGLTKHIPMSGVTMGQRRFGVDIPFQMPAGDIVFASLQSHPVDTCDIRMRGPDGIEIELVGDVIVPPDLGLPEESYKYRFRARGLDIVWSPAGQATINGRLDFEDLDTPSAIGKTLRFMSWADQGPIDIRIDIRDQTTLAATATLNPVAGQPAFAVLADLTAPLVRVSRHLKTKVPMVSIAQLDAATHLADFRRFMTADGMRMNVELADEAPIFEVTAGVGFGIIPVGDWIFAAVQRLPIVEQRRDGRNWSIAYGKPLVVESFAFACGDASPLGHFEDAYRRHASVAGTLALDNILMALKAERDE